MVKQNPKKKSNAPLAKEAPSSVIQKDRSSGNSQWIWIIAAIIITAITYSQSVNNGFITNWDDNEYVLNNEYIKDLSWNGIKNIFKVYYAGNYHPLTALSNAVEFKLFGLDPKPYHVNNLLLHLLNVWLVFLFIMQLSGNRMTSFFCALLFGIHPMHVESVAWISERKDVLYTFFYLSALIVYIRFIHHKHKTGMYIFCFLLFVLSVLSKSAAVTLPVVFLLLDYFLKRKFSTGMLLEKVPFLIVSLLMGLVAMDSQQITMELTPVYALHERFFIASYSFLFYIQKLFLPFGLNIYHMYPEKVNGLLPWYFYSAPLIILALAAAVFYLRNRFRFLLFGMLFYLITVALMLQFKSVGVAMAAERYSYVSYIGLFFIMGSLPEYFSENKFRVAGLSLSKVLMGLLAIFSVFCLALAFNRIGFWKDSLTLFSESIRQSDKVYIVYNNRGLEKVAANDIQGAIGDFSRAVELYPDYTEAWNNRGVMKMRLKQNDEAIEDLTMALQTNPEFLASYFTRANLLSTKGEYEKALTDYNKYLSAKTNEPRAYFRRGIAHAQLAHYSEALDDFTSSLKLDPGNAEVYKFRGNSLAKLDRFRDALANYESSLKINPVDVNVMFLSGLCHFEIHETEQACGFWRAAASGGHEEAKRRIEIECLKTEHGK